LPSNTTKAGSWLSGDNACGPDSVTLTKKVPLTIETPPSGFAIGSAWISHSSADYEDYIYGAFELANTGSSTRCFVMVNSISYRDASGSEIYNDALTFAHGRVNVLTSVSTATCLNPGEKTLVNLIEQLSYSEVASIHLDSISSDSGGVDAKAKLVATSYTAHGGSANIVVRNTGTGTAKSVMSTAFALNSSSEYLHWTYATSSDATSEWGPGEERTLAAPFMYDAPCPGLGVLFDFEAAETPDLSTTSVPIAPRASSAVSIHALAAAQLKQRNAIELAKFQRLQP
jgi:hypothetical protein